jgi:hypothetical protein
MSAIYPLAPAVETILDYDRRSLALYACVLEANDAGVDWRSAATTLMGLDVTVATAEACWRSHLDRAQWIIGEGLATAIEAFGERPINTR